MDASPIAGRRHVDFTRIGLGISDEVGDGRGRKRWVYDHDVRLARECPDRCYVPYEIEIELLIECRVDCVRRADHEERVAIRCRLDDRLGADIAASTRPVLND